MATVDAHLVIEDDTQPGAVSRPLRVTDFNPTQSGDAVNGLVDGRKAVTTAGTPVVLGGSLPCKWVEVTALKSNTADVYVGGSTVDAALGDEAGTPLAAGEKQRFPVIDLALLWIDSRTNGQGVSFTAGVVVV
jgi:hypothetical protein